MKVYVEEALGCNAKLELSVRKSSLWVSEDNMGSCVFAPQYLCCCSQLSSCRTKLWLFDDLSVVELNIVAWWW